MEIAKVLCLLTMAVSSLRFVASWPYDDSGFSKDTYLLPALPYGYGALEPHMDEATVKVHHQGHHAAYTAKMNAALKQWRSEAAGDKFANSSILNILQKLSHVPEKYRMTLRNNGGGYFNHAIYWACMSPKGARISPGLEKDIKDNFGTYENFKEQFTAKSLSLFGSGYVWLSRDQDGKLIISTTANQDSPVTERLHPILVIDIW
ncbi:uncharacterized protein LOC106180561 [Lingula anatina]|uniref:Superoxide dismutase n=1 Tax=Lingula anatina TaxID=7574 RepID=A0A1S3KC05_LINAN|nr:uncharacterized protein LOC106180561 [Lingula anatina]|eukprot:XP_013420027.1 uncharacterized protein LOC106180561 [Lingula anatina]